MRFIDDGKLLFPLKNTDGPKSDGVAAGGKHANDLQRRDGPATPSLPAYRLPPKTTKDELTNTTQHKAYTVQQRTG